MQGRIYLNKTTFTQLKKRRPGTASSVTNVHDQLEQVDENITVTTPGPSPSTAPTPTVTTPPLHGYSDVEDNDDNGPEELDDNRKSSHESITPDTEAQESLYFGSATKTAVKRYPRLIISS